MKKHLFTDFLIDELVYKICKTYWEAKIEDLLEKHNISDLEPYLNTKFKNGQDFFDGDPIINYYSEELNRAFRIIQEEADSENEAITAWTNITEVNEKQIEELITETIVPLLDMARSLSLGTCPLKRFPSKSCHTLGASGIIIS